MNLDSIEREEAIFNLWKKHYEPEKKSQSQMSKELGKDENYVANHISSYERRKGLRLQQQEKLSTHDFQRVQGLDDDSAKTLLEAKAEGKLEAQDLEEIAPILKGTPEGGGCAHDRRGSGRDHGPG